MKERVKTPSPSVVTAVLSYLGQNRVTLVYGAIYAAVAALFSGAETFFETAPLGLAFICAVREGLPAAFAGYLLAAMIRGGDAAVMNVSGAVIALGFRYALSLVLRRKNRTALSLRDGVSARIAASVAGGFTVSLIRIIYGGFRYYDLIAAAFYLLCAAGATYAYSCALDREKTDTPYYDTGAAALMFSAVLSLRNVSLLGISASSLCAFILTLLSGRRRGALYGVVAGFLCGAAADLSLCPMFGVTGFLCGLLSPLSVYVAVLFSLTAGLFCGLQTGGFQTLTSNLPEAAAAACAVLPAEYFGLIKKTRVSFSRRRGSVSSEIGYREAARRRREDLESLSDAISGISSAMAEVSAAEKRLTRDEAYRLADGVISSFCRDCEKRYVCYPDKGAPDRAAVAVTANVICSGRRITPSSLPGKREECPYSEAASAKLNVSRAEYEKRLSERDRAGAASSDTAVCARLVSFAADSGGKYEKDEKATAALSADPLFRDLFRGDVCVTGSGVRYITASGGDHARIIMQKNDIRRAAEKVLSVRLGEPEVRTEGDNAVFTARSVPRLEADCSAADAAKAAETVNGDVCFSVSCENVRYFAVCDGMGSGADAAATSRLAGIVLGKLLGAGCSVPDSLDVLNAMMRQRRTECFSTVDVLRLDLTDGGAAFFKCGACPSFLVRDGKVYRIASRTPPVGIMEKLCAEKVELTLKPGDLVVMSSDGADDQSSEPSWIGETLAELDREAPEEICRSILKTAGRVYGGSDDVTVLALRVREADV